MAATYGAESLTARLFCRMVEFDPDSGDATFVELNPDDGEDCLALTDNGGPKKYLFGIMDTVGTGGITSAVVYACTSAAGAGLIAVDTITPTTCNAVGDHVWIEVDVEQIHEVLATATHVGIKIDLVTTTDECAVVVIGSDGLNQYASLTADYIS
jgi:hypothetical protein